MSNELSHRERRRGSRWANCLRAIRNTRPSGGGIEVRAPLVRAAERGMTLVEIMVVVVIISMVAGVVGVAVLNRLADAQRKVAYTQIKQIGEALELYKLRFRKYPSTAEGLEALASPKGNEAPFMQQIPEDPWGNPYTYISPGQQNTRSFDILSYGPDGVQGGGDDVNNWENPDKRE